MSSSGETGDPSPPGNSRRERGKLAQRAYRKRHASKFRDLQEENKRLRDAVRKIDAAASHDARVRRWPELSAALAEARDAAGIERCPGVGLAESESPEQPRDDSAASCPGRAMSSTADIILQVPGSSLSSPSLSFGPNHSINRVGSAAGQPLTYGSWLDADPLVEISDPPPDIVPFLGRGSVTLSGCLYWSVTAYTIGVWQRSSDPGASTTISVDQDLLDGIFGQSPRLADRGYIMTLAKARLDFLRKGSATMRASDRALLGSASAMGLHEAIKADLAGGAHQLEWWRTPLQVEELAREQMTPQERGRLQACVESRAPAEEVQFLVDHLRLMARNYKCFGDGPRWHAAFASMAVGVLIKKFRGDKDGFLPT